MAELKREHFPNGQAFSQKALDAYLKARENARRDFLTKYPLGLLGGIAAGTVLSLFLGEGMVKVLLPMLCVMAGALVGTRLTTASLEAYRTQAEKIRITKADLRAARKNLKNGTFAWTAEKAKLEK